MSFLRRISIFILFFIIFTPITLATDSLEIISPTYFGEQQNIYDEIHYLKDELLSFRFCTDINAEEIKSRIICPNNEETLNLFVDKNKAGCYFINYDLQQASCGDFTLQFDYSIDSKEKKLSRKFKKEKQSLLINHILGLNYQSLTLKDMSYYIVVQNDVENKNSEISKNIYDRLKESRDNSNKCWPNGACDPYLTSLILNNLKQAGYDLNTRLLEDGKQYLEKSIVNNKNNPLKFTININHNFNTNEEISCNLGIDKDNDITYLFDGSSNQIEDFASNSISFICNSTVDTIEFKLYNIDDNIQLSKDYIDQSSFTYSLAAFACSGISNNCDYDSSLQNLKTYSSNFKESGLIQTYLDSLITNDQNETKIGTGTGYKNTGKYLTLKSNTKLVEYLKFKQNNDGSWGSGSLNDKILETSWAVLGIEKSQGISEHLRDGKNWIYFNEPRSGWSTIEKNTLAYLSIKEQIKPYLQITPVNELEEKTYFLINNPTIHNIKNLEIGVSDNIKGYLSYIEDLGDLEGESSIPFNLTYKSPFFGTLTGDIKITGLDGKNNLLTLIKFPVNLKGPSPFTIKDETIPLSEEKTFTNIIITKNTNDFSSECTYTNPFTNAIITKTITQDIINLKISNPDLITGIFNFKLKCISKENNFILTTPINISVAKKTYEVIESQINITSIFDFSINIHSLDKIKQVLSFEILGDYEGVIEATEKDKIIAANDTREIFFKITNPTFLEALGQNSNGYILVSSESGYTQKIPIILGTQTLNNSQESSLLSWVLIFFAILLIGFILLVIFRYFQLKKIHKEEGFENEDEMYFENNIESK